MKPRMCSMHICWPQLCPLGGVVESVLQRCSRWSNRFNLLSKLEYIAHIARQSSALPFGVGKPAVLCIGPSGTWIGSPHESLVKHTMNHSMACFPLLPSRLEKDRKGDPQFWYTLIRTTSWLVSLLIPISADRVDLLVCNANGISDQIATGYPWVMVLVHRLLVGKLWQSFPWFGLDRLAVHCVTGSDNSLQGDESVQLGIAIAVLYSVMWNHCFTMLFYIGRACTRNWVPNSS